MPPDPWERFRSGTTLRHIVRATFAAPRSQTPGLTVPEGTRQRPNLGVSGDPRVAEPVPSAVGRLRAAAQVPLNAAAQVGAIASGTAQLAQDVRDTGAPLPPALDVLRRFADPIEDVRETVASALPPEGAGEIAAAMVGRMLPFVFGTPLVAATLPARLGLAGRGVLGSVPLSVASARSAPEESFVGMAADLTDNETLREIAASPVKRMVTEALTDAVLGVVGEAVVGGVRAGARRIPAVQRAASRREALQEAAQRIMSARETAESSRAGFQRLQEVEDATRAPVAPDRPVRSTAEPKFFDPVTGDIDRALVDEAIARSRETGGFSRTGATGGTLDPELTARIDELRADPRGRGRVEPPRSAAEDEDLIGRLTSETLQRGEAELSKADRSLLEAARTEMERRGLGEVDLERVRESVGERQGIEGEDRALFAAASFNPAELGFASREAAQSLAGAGIGAVGGAAAAPEVGVDPATGAAAGAALVGGLAAARGRGRVRPTPGPTDLPLLVPTKRGGDIPPPSGSIRAFLRSQLTARGNLPQKVFDRMVTRDGGINAYTSQVQGTLRDYRRAARQVYGRKIPDAEVQLLDGALKGQVAVESIPETMQPVIRKMRTEIDSLSRRLIDTGAIEGRLVGTVTDNLGTYATRSYAVFDDPHWAKKVPEDVRNKAKVWLREEMLGDDRNLHLLLDNPAEFEELFQGRFVELLYRGEDGPMALLTGSKLGAKDLSILKRRKGIPPELRALWGEFTDPTVNYARSVTKMAHLVENHRFLGDVREQGLGTLFHEQPRVTEAGEFRTQIAADESSVMAPMNGLYTTPEIAEAFARAADPQELPSWLRPYMAVNGAVKYAKTVGSVMTHVRNTVGNTGFAVANGHWRLGKSVPALKAIRASTGIAEPKGDQWRDYFQRMQRLGVVHDNANAGELRDVLRDAINATLDDPTAGMAVKARAFKPGQITAATADNARRMGRKLAGGLTQVYRAEDDVWKVFAFENEFARYRAAMPDVQEEELSRFAAEIVRNTYPTYSLIPRMVKNLRRIPLVGTFVSFPAEVIRTGFNTMSIAARELADPRPAVKAIGAERLAGIAVAVGGTAAAAAGSRFLTGVTQAEDEDLREFLPSWEENSQLIHLGRRPNGDLSFIDISYTDPHSYLKRPLMAFLRGEDWQESLYQSAQELLEPFLSEEILIEKVADVARNRKKESGGPVFNPEDTFVDRSADKFGHLLDAVEPGTVSGAQRIWKGIKGEVLLYGTNYDPQLEALAQTTGHRIRTVNIPQALSWNASDFLRRRADANRVISSVANRRGEVSDDELTDAVAHGERARQRIFEDMRRSVDGAQRLGMKRTQVQQVLRSVGITGRDAVDLLNGTYRPYRPSGQFGERLRRRATTLNPDESQRIVEELRRRRKLIQNPTR